VRIILVWIAAAFIFFTFYHMVAKQDAELRDAQTVYLSLMPVDPRSVMQGDYMALNYAIIYQLNQESFDSTKPQPPKSGSIVLRLDKQNVGTFVRYYTGGNLAPNEHLLKIHRDNGYASVDAESFFIPEGTGDIFNHAAYGELKLLSNGTPLIVALCDKDLHRISAAPTDK
jgi:uncharacterized membrane-anchored protein